jgi:hypothetical protein
LLQLILAPYYRLENKLVLSRLFCSDKAEAIDAGQHRGDSGAIETALIHKEMEYV